MRTVITWVVLGLIVTFGVYEWCQPPTFRVSLVDIAGRMGLVLVVFVTPGWILASCLIVKRAIESAQKNDYKSVRSYLFSRSWLIFPLRRYAEIIRILRHLCEDRKTKPEGMSPEFSRYIIPDDFGNYVLSWEGKEKMLQIVNGGWFLNAEKAEKLTSPKTFKILMRLVVIVAIIRGIALIIHLLTRH